MPFKIPGRRTLRYTDAMAASSRRPRKPKPPECPLRAAVDAADRDRLRALLEQPNADVNRVNPEGETLLHVALQLWSWSLRRANDPIYSLSWRERREGIVRDLLEAGADPRLHRKYGLPFLLSYCLQPAIADLLMAAGLKPEEGPTHPFVLALAVGDPAAEYWWNRGYRYAPDTVNPWHALLPHALPRFHELCGPHHRSWGASRSSPVLTQTLTNTEERCARSWNAAECRRWGARLLKAGAPLDRPLCPSNRTAPYHLWRSNEDTPLMTACAAGSISAVEWLLRLGADPQAAGQHQQLPVHAWFRSLPATSARCDRMSDRLLRAQALNGEDSPYRHPLNLLLNNVRSDLDVEEKNRRIVHTLRRWCSQGLTCAPKPDGTAQLTEIVIAQWMAMQTAFRSPKDHELLQQVSQIPHWNERQHAETEPERSVAFTAARTRAFYTNDPPPLPLILLRQYEELGVRWDAVAKENSEWVHAGDTVMHVLCRGNARTPTPKESRRLDFEMLDRLLEHGLCANARNQAGMDLLDTLPLEEPACRHLGRMLRVLHRHGVPLDGRDRITPPLTRLNLLSATDDSYLLDALKAFYEAGAVPTEEHREQWPEPLQNAWKIWEAETCEMHLETELQRVRPSRRLRF